MTILLILILRALRRLNVLQRWWWNRSTMCAILGFFVTLSCLVGNAQDRAVQYAPADIRYGAQIYTAQCSICHGVNGDQINGVDFRGGQLRRASSDFELRATVTNGIAGTAMPPFKFDPSELTGIVAYIRNFRDFDARAVPVGDPSRGQALFEGAGGCANCHRVNGKGPRVSPDLSDIGTIRTADILQRSLLDPNGSLLPMNRSVHVVTRDGKVITGRRLNTDTYSCQLLHAQSPFLSVAKS